MIRLAITCGFAFETILLAALALAGCGGGEDEGWKIERTRVLGARVGAASDPTRASLSAGEAAELSWLVASPSGVREVSWVMATCVADEVRIGEPTCAGPVLDSSAGRVAAEDIRMPFTMPDDDALGASKTLLVQALFCTSGEPALDPARFQGRCEGGSEAATLASFELPVAADGAVNHNPSLDDDAIRLDGVLPPASGSAVTEGCEPSDTLPAVVAGSAKRPLAVRPREEDREARTPPASGREELLLSHFVTAGKLERQITVLFAEDPLRELSVDWTPPAAADVGEGGKLVRFFFALRDQRGGVGYATRAVCVRRP